MNLSTILAPIADDMARVNVLIRDHLHSEVALINQISSYIISAGGKRLRPAMLLLVARALGAEGDQARLLAVVIEFIHTATLLHDDVVDRADLRRGRATASSVWGNSGAVLSGDFLYSRSFQVMVEAGDMRVMHIMADATNAIAEGEVQQLMNSHDPNVDEARYLRVIELKTARLFEAAAALGAVAAGRDDNEVEQMHGVGHSIGMAYQLVDDLLDYIADPAVTGKNIGVDLADGKPTLPLIRTMLTGTSEEAALIRAAIESGTTHELPAVLKAVERGDAIPYTRALAARYRAAAVDALHKLPDSAHRQALLDMAEFVVSRSA
ncbi:MAG TPA: polyprenyl synthetase family protein [Nevskiaceae bacterium]|nr:polyprenyl synthetase family protein [Nevskiaceae bacterium]